MALSGLGCRVELMSLRGHPARSTDVFAAVYRYDPLRPLVSLRRALESARPDAVIPADELAVLHLDELLEELAATSGEAGTMGALVRRSLGGPEVFSAAESRMRLLRAAEAVQVEVPQTIEIASRAELEEAIGRLGLPLVLKADATSGGQGVRVAASAAEALKAWKLLYQAPSLARALKRGMVAKDWTHVRPWARRTTRGVTAQRFVRGRERTGMAVCREGKMAAFVCLEVVANWCERGPSSVVRVIEDAVMERAMRRVSARLGVSGFCGFDFIVEPESGTPLLIEMNPRPTQLVHLPLGVGRDLAAAYVREILGRREVKDRASVTEKELIAVFPQELQRDPGGREAEGAFHDVPWESPRLIRRALKAVPARLTEDARWRRELE